MDFKKYKEILIELNKFNLSITQSSSMDFTRYLNFEVLKIGGTSQNGVVEFENKGELVEILSKLTSNNISEITISKINDSCHKFGISEIGELYVNFSAI